MNFLLDGDALGKGQIARELLAAYKKRAKEIDAKIGNPAAIKVSPERIAEVDGDSSAHTARRPPLSRPR